MRLAITDDHRELARVARVVLSEREALVEARATLNGSPSNLPRFWKDAIELGWLGLHIAEDYGGQGFGLSELAVVTEELGRVVAPGPFLPTVVAGALLNDLGTSAERDRWLVGLCSGSVTAAIGLDARLSVRGSTATGTAGPVLGSINADLFFLPAGENILILERNAVPTITALPPLDPTLPMVRVGCDDNAISAVLEGGKGTARRVLSALAAAVAVGGMEACLDMSVEYANIRHQFGRPIGSFQAVKHLCANMLVDTELAAACAWDAARPSTNAEEADLVASVAVGWTLPAFRRVAERCVQAHGGVGYTWEHDAHLYLRRALSLGGLLGPSDMAARRAFSLFRDGIRRVRTVDLPAEVETRRGDARKFAEEMANVPAPQRQHRFAHSGYLVPHWPAPFGRSAEPAEQLVIDEEISELERPSLGIGEWVLLTVLQHASVSQTERWLWPSLEGTLRWCQLFSEPGAGSDAAAISTSARPVDGGWLVTGQKVWSSLAHESECGLATVRTDPTSERHAGITTMVITMQAPGVTVRPLTEITGETLFNEVFLDEVFVSDEDVLGEVNQGWSVARSTLGNERVSIGANPVTIQVDALFAIVAMHELTDDATVCAVGELLIEEQALHAMLVKGAARAVASSQVGPEAGVGKLVAAEHSQRVTELGLDILGPATLMGDEQELVHDYLFSRCLTIAGGTSEILRTQIAERLLGLPREPRIEPPRHA